MENGSSFKNSSILPEIRAASEPTLLVQLEPWHVTFVNNLGELLLGRTVTDNSEYSPTAFWPDVFVAAPLPWRRFFESGAYHCLLILIMWGVPQILSREAKPQVHSPFDRSSVIYYTASEYLPPVDTGGRRQRRGVGAPEYATQPIISVPPESDNSAQTVIVPPQIKLGHEVPMPNIVAWATTPAPVPIAATSAPSERFVLLNLTPPVVAPSPELNDVQHRHAPNLSQNVIAPSPRITDTRSSRSTPAPTPEIIEPPPQVVDAFTRKVGDLNIGHADVIAPAPQLPLAQQRNSATRIQSALGRQKIEVVPPPPSIELTGRSNVGGRVIALGIHPAAFNAPIAVPAGNRRGTFAAGPEGEHGASGVPAGSKSTRAVGDPYGSDAGQENVRGSGGDTHRGVPAGIFVGAHNNPSSASPLAEDVATTTNQKQHASITSPPAVTPSSRATGVPMHSAMPVAEARALAVDKEVFGVRKFYSMSLNMPNLNSAGGSWVIRFAEMPQNNNKDKDKAELIAPEATQKVDPAYPAELMRENVEGTVTLYAVIHSDGTVGDVRVLRGVDERLDAYATTALSRWHFRPATKNGSAVDLEAVVLIPFRVKRNAF
jgi:TonB family protein